MTAHPIFQLRWLLWILGAALIAHGALTWVRRRQWPVLPTFSEDLSPQPKNPAQSLHPTGVRLSARHALRVACAIFFVLAALAKWSQLRAGALNAEDFWLFEDMLRHMAQGQFFLTHFAPQSQGLLQHGIVHPMLSFALLTPFVAVLGATATALLFEPAVFALAALSLGRLARTRWGESQAFWIALAFLLSTQVGRILMYDVHPEAAYPLAVFLWAEAVLRVNSKGWTQLLAVAAASVFLAGIKEDSVLVLPPLVVALFVCRRPPKKLLALSLICAAATAGAQMGLVHYWKATSELIPQGAGLVHGAHWDSPGSALRILQSLAPDLATFLGAPLKAVFSRPFFSLLILAPFVAGQAFFWIAILPLTWASALLGEPMKFVNYYAAPFLGSFWLCAALFPPRARQTPIWTFALLAAVLIFGDGGLKYYAPNPAFREARAAIQNQNWIGKGWVPGVFLGEVPRENVLTDRDPFDTTLESQTDFVLLSESLPSFEVQTARVVSLRRRLASDPNWVEISTSARPETVSLFRRIPAKKSPGK